MPTRRQERVNHLLTAEISKLIPLLKNPRLSGLITITGVEVSSDLREARVRFSVLEEDEKIEQTTEALQHSAGFLQHEISKVLNLKVTPKLFFRLDRSLEHADEMSRLIAQARATDPHPDEDPSESNENDQD